ncbi:MAG: hypothetical protein Q8M08_11305 [Bacteroidales bacterium]|nr:hypothetical protein [Bacteroidales bacterium]
MKKIYILVLLLTTMISRAQYIQVTGTAAAGDVDALANDHIVPAGPLGPLLFDQKLCTVGNFIAGFAGNDYATICQVHAIERVGLPNPHRVSSQATSRAKINGDNTTNLSIIWKNHGTTYARTDGHDASVFTTLNFSVNMSVMGIPPGTPVTVYWRYNIFGAGSTEHEDLTGIQEDPISVVNTMEINGVSQLKNSFNFATLGGLPGWNEWKNKTGTFRVMAGTDFTFGVSSDISLLLQVPGIPGPGFPVDQNDGIFKGDIIFSVVPLFPPVVNNTADSNALVLFSLDIGSDSELSDPQANGNELFDPGDMYPGVTMPVLMPVPWKNDSLIFVHDPDPKPFPPINPAPVGSGLAINAVNSLYFDLDGSDLLASSLSGMTYGPGFPSIPWFNDSCIYEAEYIFVSFDDDTPELYTSILPPSVPVNSSSPVMNTIYSEFGKKDEVMEYDLDAMPPSGISFRDEIFSEGLLHFNLIPDPAGNNTFDDDMDALDIIPISGNYTPCAQWYISADHEAAYSHPSIPAILLDPGAIYQVTPTGPIPVIDGVHTGLPYGTDLNDFEFAWVWDTSMVAQRYGLAILFTVAADDIMTVEDETGGLDPQMIYYSFLNGSSQEFSSYQFKDPIDGLTVWKNSLNGTLAFPNPIWGTKTWTGSDGEKWHDGMNWFPQGVPFDPEDVIIPDVLPAPIIFTNGLDCDDLFISKGAILTIKPGNTFTARGSVTLDGP